MFVNILFLQKRKQGMVNIRTDLRIAKTFIIMQKMEARMNLSNTMLITALVTDAFDFPYLAS